MVKKFFQEVDKRNRKEMIEFLSNHFRYNTMNSWNRSSSYANKMKIYTLDLPKEIEDKLWEMLNVEEAWFYINQHIRDYKLNGFLPDGYDVGFNGRSGGYLVLYVEKYCGRSIDQDADFENEEEWDIWALRNRVELVQSFDKLCDEIVDMAIWLAENMTVEEETYKVEKTRKVLVEKEGVE